VSRRKHIHSGIAGVLCLILLGLGAQHRLRCEEPAGFRGDRAFEDLKKIVAFGPRPAGSKALRETREWMLQRLKETGAQIEEDPFVASTPVGNISMTNLIVKFPGARSQVVIVAGHYDTMRSESFRFVGANDGGSSAALLMELSRLLGQGKHALTYWLVFFDGEEAEQQWSDSDSLYGSRHLVQKLAATGELSRVGAMILVDMIGEAKLDVRRDANSTPWLTDLVFHTARQLGYGKNFLDDQTAVVDDHMPFVNAGVSAVDLIGLNYGPRTAAHAFGGYWHTANDTLEHCSALSMTIVGRVVLASLAELEKSPRLK